MKTTKGRFSGGKSVMGRITCERAPFAHRRGLLLATAAPRWTDAGYAGIVTTAEPAETIGLPPQMRVADLAPFVDGDVALLKPDGGIFFLWEAANRNNALLLTEACNCHCIMCPQPPKEYDHDHGLVRDALHILELAPAGFTGEICLTGGEPTLCGDALLRVLAACRARHPQADIIMLTNGKRFSDFVFAKRFAMLGVPLTVAVSLHADVDTLHDEIVGAPGSFRLTQKGLYNLAKLKQRIEIRIVVSRLNCKRLPQIARHIARNYPFAAHVTFMGLELQGNARRNYDTLWVDPVDYGENLEMALHELHRAGLNVSTYNHPLCLLPRAAWPFARQSISDWKNAYLPACAGCSVRDRCCGFFTTSGDRVSPNVRPIRDETAG